MNAVEILLLFVVGISVLVFFILDNLESPRKHGEACDDEKERSSSVSVSTGSTLIEIIGVGDPEISAIPEKAVLLEDVPRAGGESGNSVEVNSEKSNFCSGERVDDGEADDFIDDWEGIERTELERVFGKAVVFVNSNSNAHQIGELMLQLYGLQRAALEGPCHGSQPMILNVSARAEWNAWQKVGDISREMAMEEYVEILSRAIPGWNRMVVNS